ETEQTTQAGTRYGCFLPDLTGLARGLSAADLPPHYIRCPGPSGKFQVPRQTATPGRRTATPRASRSADSPAARQRRSRSEEHTSELQSPYDLVCRLLLEKKK